MAVKSINNNERGCLEYFDDLGRFRRWNIVETVVFRSNGIEMEKQRIRVLDF